MSKIVKSAISGANMHQRRHNAKITIVGGGSLYCAGLMQSIVRHPDMLRGCHIVLTDTNEDDLHLIYTMSDKLLRHAGAPLTIEHTTNLEDALTGTDFVLTTLRAGGLPARVLDEQIPQRYGIIGHDTIGPGGFFYALRTAPILAEIAADIEKHAPKAFLLNYTTPSNIVLEAIAHSSGIRVIGLHDVPVSTTERLATEAGILPIGKRLRPRTIGLDHAYWTTAIWSNGEDVLPDIVAWSEEYISRNPTFKPDREHIQATLTARYRAIPSPFLHYYYFPEQVLEAQKSSILTPAEELLQRIPQLRAHYRTESQKGVPQLTHTLSQYTLANQSTLLYPDTLSPEINPDPNQPLQADSPSDFLLAVLHSILNDTGEEWALTVQNNGAISFLEDDHMVHLPCRVDARGATPLVQGNGGLDMDQRGLIAMLAEYEGATAHVALWGNRYDAIKALASNPLVMSYSKAEQLYNALSTAHAQYLPERLLR